MAFVAATFVRLCGYLQDPRLVANFQRLCGVEGTFSEKEETTTRLKGDPPKQPDQDREEYPRQRNPPRDPETKMEEREDQEDHRTRDVGNGSAGEPGGDGGGGDGDAARAKPLRRNSLTGDAGHEFIVRNRLLFYLFTFGTELGNEMFFIAFFPFLFWNVDALVGRRLIVVWAWNLFLGQSTKDLVRWSRPASPPVVKVEVFYNSEYSMPSTHAMTGTAIPFSLFLLSCGRWEYSFSFGLSVALAWSLLVCVSRVYMGMHSVLEVITGFLYSLLILAVLQPMLDAIDGFYATHPLAPLAIVLSHVGMGLLAFSLDSWSTSRGDTAQALGTGVGTALGTHVNHRLGLLTDPPLSALPLAVPAAGLGLVGRSLARFVLGVAVLLVCRMVMKAVTIPGLCRVFGIPAGDVRSARQHMRVELPYRYIVYSAVGFCCVSVVPFVFGMVNLA
ncbi:Sphingosine-1-phosphate phosphatase 1 [Merluccius polli]|uniref:Sphingosine-1-phosphate phosphatase 1 n=1 Tax=Merluccius polli TaxID=89951 RepID=A0AA47ME46_MERPO|nr:Sphingosine-1-phosphate phosphatase 1 [Merluccius polli]